MKIQLTVERLILRCIESNVGFSEAAKMVDIIFCDRTANSIATELYRLGNSDLLKYHEIEYRVVVCGLTESIQTISGREYALHVARAYDKVYNS